jgi:hypothetical protein
MDRLNVRACSTVFVFSLWVALIKPNTWAVEEGSSAILTRWGHSCTREEGHCQQYVDSVLVPLQNCNEDTCITIAVAYVWV